MTGHFDAVPLFPTNGNTMKVSSLLLSIAIVQMANEPQSAYESHYRNLGTILSLLSALQWQNPDSKISSENITKSSKRKWRVYGAAD